MMIGGIDDVGVARGRWSCACMCGILSYIGGYLLPRGRVLICRGGWAEVARGRSSGEGGREVSVREASVVDMNATVTAICL
jgi:hypothetical protein